MTFLDKNNEVKHWEIQNKWQVSFRLQSLAAMNSHFFSDSLDNFKLTFQLTPFFPLGLSRVLRPITGTGKLWSELFLHPSNTFWRPSRCQGLCWVLALRPAVPSQGTKVKWRENYSQISRVQGELFTNQQSSGLQSCDEDTPAGVRRAQQRGDQLFIKVRLRVGKGVRNLFTCYVTLCKLYLKWGLFSRWDICKDSQMGKTWPH